MTKAKTKSAWGLEADSSSGTPLSNFLEELRVAGDDKSDSCASWKLDQRVEDKDSRQAVLVVVCTTPSLLTSHFTQALAGHRAVC